MAQVAFLASIVGPRVAAAAAQGALEALADEDPQPIASEARVALQEARAAGETAADGDAAKGSASAPSPPGNDTAASEPGNGNGPESGNSTPAGAVGSQGQVSGSALANAEKAPGAEGFEVVEGSPKPLTEGRLRVAAATALAAAAVKAKLLADQEEREIQRLVVGVIQNQARGFCILNARAPVFVCAAPAPLPRRAKSRVWYSNNLHYQMSWFIVSNAE